MAVRRDLFRPLQPDEDADDALPLDVLLQGYRVVFVPGALAFDMPPGTAAGELAARARMTVLALTALVRRKSLLNPLRFPGLTLALLSHRLLRVLTPVFLGGLLVSSAAAVTRPLGLAALAGQLLLYAAGGFAGWLGDRAPAVARMAWSFCVWNSGFALGLARFVAGRRLTRF